MNLQIGLISPITLLLSLLLQFRSLLCQSLKNVHLGFPEAWDGDKFPALYCPAKNIPKWLDGYFLCQLSAAYGNASAPPGQKLTHMIDAIGAIGSFHISAGEVVFSARYYPSRPYRIWEFYDRNMSKASVPWAGWSHYNLTAMTKWEQVPVNPESARFHPNLDFWRIGKRVIAGTEAPYWIGYEFDVPTLSNFRLAPFVEDNDIFGAPPRPSLIPISMAIHGRVDPMDGTLWGAFSAMNFDEERFYQGLFTIDTNGVRRVVGMYDYGVWDAKACAKDTDEYIGDKSLLPGYMHSISSTEHYVLLPITSLIINPCKFKEPPRTAAGEGDPHVQAGGLWGMDFYDMVPMRFLVFDKRTRSWLTQKPLEVFPSMFVTHQLNAFEDLDGNIVADMVVYDSHDPYVKYFYTDFLRSQLYPNSARILRFTLDLRTFRVMYSYLIPQETIAADFPQVNPAIGSRPYQWAYLLEHPFAGGNQLLKINVNEPAGARNSRFKPDDDAQLVLHEPYFHARPGATREDDGVLLVRGLDLEEDKGVLLVVDATSMQEIGRAFVPISVPFGFHNRFFSSQELGITSKDPRDGDELEEGENFKNKRKKPAQKPKTATTKNRHFWERMANNSNINIATARPPGLSWLPVHPEVAGRDHDQAVELLPLPVPDPAEIPLPPDQTPLPWWPTRKTITTPGPPSNMPDPVPPPPPPSLPFAPPPAMSTSVPEQSPFRKTEDRRKDGGAAGALTMRQLYERTLRALCRWLPRVIRGVSFQGCVQSGERAIRWMSPLAQRLTQSPIAAEEEHADGQAEGGEQYQQHSPEGQRQRSALRPVLAPPPQSPWYNSARRSPTAVSGKGRST